MENLINVKKVTSSTIEDAIYLQATIFPTEICTTDLTNTIENIRPAYQERQEYYVGYVGETPVGITGLYSFIEHPNDVWIGWFGIHPDHRKKHYATQLFNFTMNLAKSYGYETLRLFTDTEYNKEAIMLYKKMGMQEEIYQNPLDKHKRYDTTIVLSMSLNNKPLKLWNSKNLFLLDHEERNK